MKMLHHLLILLAVTSLSISHSVKYKASYFDNVTLHCDEKALRPPYSAFLKYWILPNNTVLQWSQQPNGKHRLSIRPIYSLIITHVDDDDFGWYQCVILWDNRIFLVDAIKVGLFVDYNDQWTKFRKRLIIGGIVSGASAVLLLVVCLFGYSFYRQTDESKKRDEERRVVYELDKTVQKFDEAAAAEDEVTLPLSMISSASTERIGGYDTTENIQKTVAIDTMSSQSSGFYDNKAFDIENEAIIPFEESDSDMLNLTRDYGDLTF